MFDTVLESLPSIEIVVFTGGELLLLNEDLFKIIKYVHKKGKMSRIVSNAYWATTQKNAVNVVSKLVKAGLTEINFSTGDEHQQFVPLENIINAIVASQNSNLVTAVNVESHQTKKFNSSELINEERLKKYLQKGDNKLFISNGAWMPFNEETKKIFRLRISIPKG